MQNKTTLTQLNLIKHKGNDWTTILTWSLKITSFTKKFQLKKKNNSNCNKHLIACKLSSVKDSVYFLQAQNIWNHVKLKCVYLYFSDFWWLAKERLNRSKLSLGKSKKKNQSFIKLLDTDGDLSVFSLWNTFLPFPLHFFFYKKYTKIGVEISIHVP